MYLLGVIAEAAEDCRGKIDLLTVKNLLAKRSQLDLGAKFLEVLGHPSTHVVYMLAVSISRL